MFNSTIIIKIKIYYKKITHKFWERFYIYAFKQQKYFQKRKIINQKRYLFLKRRISPFETKRYAGPILRLGNSVMLSDRQGEKITVFPLSETVTYLQALARFMAYSRYKSSTSKLTLCIFDIYILDYITIIVVNFLALVTQSLFLLFHY